MLVFPQIHNSFLLLSNDVIPLQCHKVIGDDVCVDPGIMSLPVTVHRSVYKIKETLSSAIGVWVFLNVILGSEVIIFPPCTGNYFSFLVFTPLCNFFTFLLGLA